MGVKGLKRWVSVKCNSRRTLLSKRKEKFIAIDALGFMYFLYKTESLDWLYGGQFSRFEAALVRYITSVRKVGFEPVFFFDGKRDENKWETSLQRAKERAETCNLIKTMIKEGTLEESFVRRNMLSPSGIRRHYVHIVRANNCRIMKAAYEADGDIAKFFKSNPGDCFAVWTNDSDLLCYKDIPRVVFFEDITLTSAGDICCNYFEQTNVLANLNIPANFLPALVAMLGNDLLNSKQDKLHSDKIKSAVAKECGLRSLSSCNNVKLITICSRYLQKFKRNSDEHSLDAMIAKSLGVPIGRFQSTRLAYFTLPGIVEETVVEQDTRICFPPDFGQMPLYQIMEDLRYCAYTLSFLGRTVAEYNLIESSQPRVFKIRESIHCVRTIENLKQETLPLPVLAIKVLRQLVPSAGHHVYDLEWRSLLSFLATDEAVNQELYGGSDTSFETLVSKKFIFRVRSIIMLYLLTLDYLVKICDKPADYNSFDGILYSVAYERNINDPNSIVQSAWENEVFEECPKKLIETKSDA
mmetsp:Transcript_14016/g.16407  ORF Transcript_14016/g.16407 Transcript_14016/m.16407 type:complete len:525 (+) Transcript_14016:204-1778(+)